MAGLLRRLFRIGKLPADVRAQVEAEGVIHLSECVGVAARFTGHVPGRRSVGLVRAYGGALVLTNRRLLATMSALPGRSGRAVDQPWTTPKTGAVSGTLSATGLTLQVADLSSVDPEFSGTLSVTYTTGLSADVLARVPARTLAFDVPPTFVYSVLGVPRG